MTERWERWRGAALRLDVRVLATLLALTALATTALTATVLTATVAPTTGATATVDVTVDQEIPAAGACGGPAATPGPAHGDGTCEPDRGDAVVTGEQADTGTEPGAAPPVGPVVHLVALPSGTAGRVTAPSRSWSGAGGGGPPAVPAATAATPAAVALLLLLAVRPGRSSEHRAGVLPAPGHLRPARTPFLTDPRRRS